MKPSVKEIPARVWKGLRSDDGRYYISRFTAILSVFLCVLSVFLYLDVLTVPDETDIAYPLEKGVNTYNPYVQQFDALKKGQTHIDYPADPRLEELENVYDNVERGESGIYYLWDRAYYQGKYYSYFGLTPVLTVYYPYYLTHHSLPTDRTVMAVFLFIAALFIPLTVWQWAWNFAPKTPTLLLFFAAPAAFYGSLLLLIARGYTPFYYIAVISGGAFLSLFLWLVLCAYGERIRWLRIVLYVLAGIAFGLVLQARINIAFLAAFLVVPGLWFFIIGREREGGDAKGKGRVISVLSELAALGLPVAAFLMGSMIFNAMRFSGPLDFGTAYQLTVADTSTYRVRLTDLPYAVYHYLLALPRHTETYPFVSFNYVRMSDYGHYVYRDAGLGLFSSPVMYGMALLPLVQGSEKQPLRRRIMILCGIVGIFVTALLDFCLGGIIYRYTADMTVLGAILAVVVVASVAERAAQKNRKVLLWGLTAAFIAFFLYAAFAAVRISLINDNGNVVKYSAEIAEKLIEKLPFKPFPMD